MRLTFRNSPPPSPLSPVAAPTAVETETVEIKGQTLFSSQPALLCASNLLKTFGGQTVLNRVSVQLSRGEVVLLRGANGSGKTTLLNILSGNLEPDAGVIELLTVRVPEAFRFPRYRAKLNPFDRFAPERVAQAGVGRTWQDIRLFTSQNLLENIAVAAPRQLGENPARAILQRGAVRTQEEKIKRDAKEILMDLGLEGRETSGADRVSLGQSKRVAIARAVVAGARILFLDEPLAGLDAAGIDEVMYLLQKLAREKNVTLVIVEHIFNIPRILDLATTVWTLDAGNLKVESPDVVRSEIKQTAGESVQNWIKPLAGADGKIIDRYLSGGAVLSTIVPSGVEPAFDVLQIEDLVVYRGQRLVIGSRQSDGSVRGLSLGLPRGLVSVLQAPNGWGKTTLMEALAGLIPIARGTIRLNGRSIEELPPWERVALGFSLLQARHNTFPSLTVREALHLSHRNVPPDLRKLLGQKISNLSGGERQKVALACVIEKGNYLLMDEPFSALDDSEVFNYFKNLMDRPRQLTLIAIPALSIQKRAEID